MSDMSRTFSQQISLVNAVSLPHCYPLAHYSPLMLTTEILQFSGILDGTRTQELRDRINQAIERDAKTILVDLSDVTFMDSSGLGALVTALKAVRATGGKLCICSVNEQVKILFELTSMDRVFEIFRDQSDFQRLNGVVPSIR